MWRCFSQLVKSANFCQTWHSAWMHDNKIYLCAMYRWVRFCLVYYSVAYHWHIKTDLCFFRKCGWRKQRRVPDMSVFPSSIWVSSALLLCTSFPGSSNKQNSDLWPSPHLRRMWCDGIFAVLWGLLFGLLLFCRQIR